MTPLRLPLRPFAPTGRRISLRPTTQGGGASLETVGDDVVTTLRRTSATGLGCSTTIQSTTRTIGGNLIYALAPPNDDPYSRDY